MTATTGGGFHLMMNVSSWKVCRNGGSALGGLALVCRYGNARLHGFKLSLYCRNVTKPGLLKEINLLDIH